MGPASAPGFARRYARGSAGRAASPPRMVDLRKVTTPILLHLLEGKVRFPKLFLLRCRLTVGRFKKRIDPRFPAELVALAALPLWVYVNLKRRLGPARAFEIMRVAILTGGVAQWNLTYETVETERTFAHLCDQELEVNRTGPTRWNTLEVVDRTDRRFEIKITRCLYHELATSVGVPEITPVICQIDNAAFNAYLPDRVIFHRGGPGNRIADGKRECRFVWEVKEDGHER
jgi:L-2-amino-thiazoline-4-carboxylic acid hydrolase